MKPKKLFIVVNVDWFFLSHRKPVAMAAKDSGYDVTIVTCNTGKLQDIKDLGLKTVDMPMARFGMNPLKEFRTLIFLYRLYKKEKPDTVHHVGLKPVLWGSLAAKLAKVPAEVNAISGLGTLFIGEKKSFVAKSILRFMRFTHNKENVVDVFQNNDDRSLFEKEGLLERAKPVIIEGSGVDLKNFPYTPEPDTEKVRILFSGRMLKTKGVVELFDAAELLREKCRDRAEFVLCGALDGNPDALTEDEILNRCDDNYIQWLGSRKDMDIQCKNCHIYCLPSYREGMPKSTLEAMGIGRPVVTTDAVGCRDTVVEGYNGFKVPIGDSKLMAERLYTLIMDKDLRVKMGKNSRQRAEEHYDIEIVKRKHIEIYDNLCSR